MEVLDQQKTNLSGITNPHKWRPHPNYREHPHHKQPLTKPLEKVPNLQRYQLTQTYLEFTQDLPLQNSSTLMEELYKLPLDKEDICLEPLLIHHQETPPHQKVKNPKVRSHQDTIGEEPLANMEEEHLNPKREEDPLTGDRPLTVLLFMYISPQEEEEDRLTMEMNHQEEGTPTEEDHGQELTGEISPEEEDHRLEEIPQTMNHLEEDLLDRDQEEEDPLEADHQEEEDHQEEAVEEEAEEEDQIGDL